MALALRRLAAGRMTNDDFDDEVFDFDASERQADPALDDLGAYGWLHYTDLRSYCLRGRDALSAEQRRGIARCVLFLKTDQKYRHGSSIRDRTALSGPAGAVAIGIVGIAICVAIDRWIAFGTLGALFFGFTGVIAAAWIILWLYHFTSTLWHRFAARRIHQRLVDSFWPFNDEQASSETVRFWPFADEHSYRTALANPPYLAGPRH